ncbi:MAG: response regulator [Magnetococcus sp. DMHC-6]
MNQKTALIVDDSSLARMLVRKLFSTNFKEWHLLEAKDGDEALLKLESTPIHLALIDFNMPGMDGLQLAEKILNRHPRLPTYLVTANIQERMKIRAESMGIGFVKKPVDQQKIKELIELLKDE